MNIVQLIGKGGSNIKRIRAAYGGKVNINIPSRGSTDRWVEIVASTRGVLADVVREVKASYVDR